MNYIHERVEPLLFAHVHILKSGLRGAAGLLPVKLGFSGQDTDSAAESGKRGGAVRARC